MSEPITWIYGRWGIRGVQLAALGYLGYRYLRAFVTFCPEAAGCGDGWAWGLLSTNTQLTLFGHSISFIAITVGTPIIVMLLDWTAHQSAVDANSHGDEPLVLNLAVLALSTIFVWMVAVWFTTKAGEFHGPIAGDNPVFVGAYTLFSIVAGWLVVRRWRQRREGRAAGRAGVPDDVS